MDPVEVLMSAGLSKEQAEAKVASMRQLLERAGVTDPEKLLQQKVQSYVAHVKRGLARFRGICVGVTEKRDILAGLAAQAQAAYKENPQLAVAQGLVRVEQDGTVIPLDNRETWEDGTPNPNYGKPLKPVFRRTGVFICDGELKVVQGNFDAERGKDYVFWGMESEDRVSGARSFVEVGTVPLEQLWNLTLEAGQKSKYAVDMSQLQETKNGDMVAVIGFVENSGPMKTGDGMWVNLIDYDSGSEIVVFSRDKDLTLPENCQAIAIGRKFVLKSPQGEQRIAIDGVVVWNPEVPMSSDLSEELDAILLDTGDQDA